MLFFGIILHIRPMLWCTKWMSASGIGFEIQAINGSSNTHMDWLVGGRWLLRSVGSFGAAKVHAGGFDSFSV